MHDVVAFIKDFLWAPLLLLIGFVWNLNEKKHDAHSVEAKAIRDDFTKLKEASAMGYSNLNDRIMEHVDGRMRETIAFVQAEDAKLMGELSMQRGHIGKIFDKMEAQSQRSEDRHLETMNAIHTLATTMHQALAAKADR